MTKSAALRKADLWCRIALLHVQPERQHCVSTHGRTVVDVFVVAM